MGSTLHDDDVDQIDQDARASLRTAYLRIAELGVLLTRAIEDAGARGLSGNADVTVLQHLDAGPQRPRDLLEPTGLTSAGLTNLLDRLEQHGLLDRVYGSLDDRRGVLVEATPAGHDLAGAMRDAVAETYADLVPLRREILRLVGFPGRRLHNVKNVPPAELVDRLATLGDALIEASTLDDHPDDPSPTRTMVVLAAAADGGTRPREILGLTTLSTGGVTQLLDRIEAHRLITRTTGQPPDRRAVTVQLTPAGLTALTPCLDRLGAYRDKIAAALT